MSPHALTDSDLDLSPVSSAISRAQGNGQGNSHGTPGKSQLQATNDDDIHDLICVGFGPASLAIAIALHDALESGHPSVSGVQPKVRFLERQQRFAWHAGMLLPGAKMQISFVKDLATLRNPRSNFTFLNYLHQKDRLVAFTNLGTFLPQRIEYENYMRWCADHFDDVVDYDQSVESVDVDSTNAKTGEIQTFRVTSLDRSTGRTCILRAKHVVIAAGGKPNIPKCLQTNHPRIIHSSQYATSINHIFPPGTQPRSVAIIGGGQSAAEVFHNIPHRYPGCRAYLLIRGSALRPSDDSPFVNEIFDPSRVEDVYSQAPQIREAEILHDKATNYGVVRLELLEEIYSTLYSYRLQYEKESDWPRQILNHRDVTGMSEGGQQAVRLHVQNHCGEYQAGKDHERTTAEDLDVDLVVVASGYRRDAHEDMLRGLEHLKAAEGKSPARWGVNRDYSVQFQQGAVQRGSGVWLQGCNEGTHGLSDTLLSILATRGGEVMESIFGSV